MSHHQWGLPHRVFNERDEHIKSERRCLNGCGCTKVTHHPPAGRAFVTYCRETEDAWLETDARPECSPLLAGAPA